ncbi:type II restriction endonuclease [Cupriavidus sp. HMR-1]|uniref:type II restriction endonuclease n=1 Tax=Cupriavidus sp. HMR-1 TaxID=1249621 RepID=UPI00187BD03C|nr:type II restriction endonuclease [Cupriavidus sp. HMR-1]
MGLSRACIKTLAAVEADPNRSNQHEFNGVAALKAIFGLEKVEQPAIFSIRGENVTTQASVTWYDARLEHPTRTEHRLYFQTNPVMEHAQAGDNVVIGFDSQRRLNLILLPRNSEPNAPVVDAWTPVVDD